jgi:hypothetical protein
MWLLLLSVTVVCILAAWSGYRSALLLAAVYGVAVLAWWFVQVAP